MVKINNKVMASILTGTMLLGTISGAVIKTENTKVVYAESNAFKKAKAKINQLVKSMKTNYLGIKNIPTWEKSLDEAAILLSKVPKSEYNSKEGLEFQQVLFSSEMLISTVYNINYVEKSMAPKSIGGYGNYLGIKNAEVWEEYLDAIDLESNDNNIYIKTFDKQYEELSNRRSQAKVIIKDIKDKFQVEYDTVIKLFNEAKAANDKEKAKVALVEAEKLGTCSRSDNLERDIKEFIKK